MPLDEHQRDIAPEEDRHLRAAEEVRKGWCQRIDEDRQGNTCALGALRKSNRWNLRTVYPKARAKLEKTIGIGQGEIPRWNDAPGRTAEEVATMMERAAGVEPIGEPAAKELCHAL